MLRIRKWQSASGAFFSLISKGKLPELCNNTRSGEFHTYESKGEDGKLNFTLIYLFMVLTTHNSSSCLGVSPFFTHSLSIEAGEGARREENENGSEVVWRTSHPQSYLFNKRNGTRKHKFASLVRRRKTFPLLSHFSFFFSFLLASSLRFIRNFPCRASSVLTWVFRKERKAPSLTSLTRSNNFHRIKPFHM